MNQNITIKILILYLIYIKYVQHLFVLCMEELNGVLKSTGAIFDASGNVRCYTNYGLRNLLVLAPEMSVVVGIA